MKKYLWIGVILVVTAMAFHFAPTKNPPAVPTAKAQVANPVATPATPAIDTSLDTDTFMFQWRVKDIKLEMSGEEPSATASEVRAWNDRLCDSYMAVIGLRNVLDRNYYSDEAWSASGFSREDGTKKFRLASDKFAGELEELMMLPQDKREKLESEWTHTCDGMLPPSDMSKLTEVYRKTLRDANLDREVPKPIRKILVELGSKPEE